MPTYSVPTLGSDGRTVTELVRAVNVKAAIDDATVRGLRVSDPPEVVVEPETDKAAESVMPTEEIVELVFDRAASAGVVLAWLGLLLWPLSLAGIVLGAIGGRSKGTAAIFAGLFTFFLNVVVCAIVWRSLAE